MKIIIFDKKGYWEVNEVKYPLQRNYKNALVKRIPKETSLTWKELKAVLKKDGIVIAEKLVIKGEKGK